MDSSQTRTTKYSVLEVFLRTLSEDDQTVVSMWKALEGKPEARKNLFQDVRFRTSFLRLIELEVWHPSKHSSVNDLSEEERHDAVEIARRNGFSFAEATELLKPHRGRPVTHRKLAILALDLHLNGHSWNQVAQKLCPCNKARHDRNCKETLRQQVNSLKKLLAKYNIPTKPPVNK